MNNTVETKTKQIQGTKFDVNTALTERFIKAIKDGVSPFQSPWSSEQGMPRNISGRPYRGINFFSTLLSCIENNWEVPVFLTFKQIREAGYNLIKGSRSTMIKYTTVVVPKEYKDCPDDCPPEERRIMNKYYNVFCIHQCEGIDLEAYKVVRPDNFSPIKEADLVHTCYPDAPAVEITGVKAYYSPKEDKVVMPDKDRFHSSEDFYSVLFHELTHSTGHESRLNRGLDGRKKGDHKEQYAYEELIAELGAAFLCSHCGFINATFDNSASYLDSWLQAFESDSSFLISAASKAQKAVDHILGVTFE